MDEPIRVTARRADSTPYTHSVTARTHELLIDEPRENGGDDAGPTPQELLAASVASCTAITIEMYARRKDWDVGGLEVRCEFTPPEPGSAARFELLITLPDHLSEEQRERLRVIAAKCPVHRALAGDVQFDDQVEVVGPGSARST